MAKSVRLDYMRDQVRDRTEQSSEFVGDNELTDYVNDSIAALYDLLIKHDQLRYRSTDTIVVVSGTQSYSLAADYYQLKAVELEDTSHPNGYRTMHRIPWEERHHFHGSSATDKYSARYVIDGGQLHIYPKPSWSGNVQVVYIPTPTLLSADGDTFDGINDWTEWVILDVMIKVRDKANESTSDTLKQQARVEKRITGLAQVDRSKPRVMSDIRGRFRGIRRRFLGDEPW